MNKLGYCVICRIKLEAEDEQRNVQNCPQCKKTYYLKSEIVDLGEEAQFVHADKQTELEGIQSITEGGLLVSSSHITTEDFPLPSQTKENETDKMLKKHFGSHVTITSEEINPV